jgi:hypothetical protein
MLFTELSIWTMIHGIVLGGAALMALSAALFTLHVQRTAVRGEQAEAQDQARSLGRLTVFIAALLWLGVLVGTYVLFPPYRATPPAQTIDLGAYPKSLIEASPDTAWLHAFAMESKEHLPWIASMIATAVAFVGVRYRSGLLNDRQLRRMAMTLLVICFGLVAFVSLMGIFVNKVAPLR